MKRTIQRDERELTLLEAVAVEITALEQHCRDEHPWVWDGTGNAPSHNSTCLYMRSVNRLRTALASFEGL